MKLKLTAILLVVFSIVASVFSYVNYGQNNDFLGGDSLGYYSYLPAAFIYDNLTHMDISGNEKVVPEKIRDYLSHPPYDNPPTPLGKNIVQYTIGISLMEMPFFLIGHYAAMFLGYSTDGLSPPYQIAVKISNWFYLILGFVFLFKSLCFFYSRVYALLVCSLLYIATNLFYFSTCHFGMAHIPVFFLVACVIYLTILIHQKPAWTLFLILGVCLGMIALIRITDLVIAFVPIFYSVYDKKTFIDKIDFVKQNIAKIGIAILVSILPFVPQLMYWKAMSGQYFYYSYGHQKLDLLKPHLIAGIFETDNGWLHYSPFMIFSVIGLFFIKKNKELGLASILVFITYSYLVYSWFCFQYINGFGSRPMIDIYPLLAFPITAFLVSMSNQKVWIKTTATVVIVGSLAISLVFSYKQVNGLLWSECSSFLFNTSTFFKTTLDQEDLITLEIPNLQPRDLSKYNVETIAIQNFESDTDNTILDTSLYSRVYHLENNEYSIPLLRYNFQTNKAKDVAYIKVSGKFYLNSSSHYYYSFSNFSFNVFRNEKWLFGRSCKIDNKLGLSRNAAKGMRNSLWEIQELTWDTLDFYFPVPSHVEFQEGDVFEVSVSSPMKSGLLIDDVSISYLYKR